MNKLIILILVVVSFWSTTTARLFSQSWEWEIQAKGLATRWQGIDAIDSNVAVAFAWKKASNGKEGIFRTLDSGGSWHEIPWIPERQGGMVDISVIDSLNIWILTPFAIDHTADAGRTWELQYSGDSTTSWFNYIEMFDSLNGVAMGDALPGGPVLILRTENGGKSWNPQNKSHFVNASCLDVWRSIHFLSPDIGYGRFTYSGVPLDKFFLQKTIDGGRTWTATALNVINFTLIRFCNENIGLAAGLGNEPIFRTIDGGQSWKNYPPILAGGWAEDIEFFPNDASKVIAAFGSYFGFSEGNHLIFSSDTGKTWIELSTPDIGIFRDIEMVGDKHGWIVGEKGIIYISTTEITSVINDKLMPEEFTLYQNYPNPFNPVTTISYQLSAVRHVDVSIYNALGQKVATLVSEKQPAGHYKIEWNATGFSTGMYFCQLEANEFVKVIKLVLAK